MHKLAQTAHLGNVESQVRGSQHHQGLDVGLGPAPAQQLEHISQRPGKGEADAHPNARQPAKDGTPEVALGVVGNGRVGRRSKQGDVHSWADPSEDPAALGNNLPWGASPT